MQTDDDIKKEAEQIAKEYEEDPDQHVPVDTMHQSNLHQQMSNIDMDKEITVNSATDPNPFKEDNIVDSSVDKLNEAMIELFKNMSHSNTKIDIDDITV